MTRTRPNERVDTQARVLESLAIDVTRALEHIQRELAATDWHTGDSADNAGGAKGGEPASPTERVALARYELTGRREDIRDWIDALEQVSRSGRFLVDEALKIRSPHTELFDATEYGKRCNGKVDATCVKWATDHRHPVDNTTVDGLCDACFVIACQICFNRSAEERRVNGRPSCQACYRRSLRDTLKASA